MGIFSREEIRKRLRQTLAEGKPIFGAGCSCGLFAKCAEIGGADMIMVYSTGLSRLKGLPTWTIGDANEITLNMMDEISLVVKNTPIIAGVEAQDPTRKMENYLQQLIDAGCSGVINVPPMTLSGKDEYWRKSKEDVGLGVNKEIELVRLGHEMGMFTISFVRFNYDIAPMIEAGVDMICVHSGKSAGGLVGRVGAPPMEETVNQVQDMAKIINEINPNYLFQKYFIS